MANNALNFLFGAGETQSKEIYTDIIKIRGSSILLEDKIININNISVIEIVSLAISFPWIAPILFLISITSFYSTNSRFDMFFVIFGIIMLCWGLYLISYYYEKLSSKGLLIVVNAGLEASILIRDKKENINFLREVAVTLYNIINTKALENLDINLNQKNIQEIYITGISNSVISTGSIAGNITNSVI